jgi:hypothetical protein
MKWKPIYRNPIHDAILILARPMAELPMICDEYFLLKRAIWHLEHPR